MLQNNSAFNQKIVSLSAFVLFIIQLLLVNEFTVEFPNFGDDLYFLKFTSNYDYKNFQISNFYYPFHGAIHVNLMNKLVLVLLYFTTSVINFKMATLLANLIYLIILYYFINYFKKIELKPIYQICFLLLFFSLKGNSDNFNLIGIMQHGLATFAYFVSISYFITVKKKYTLSIILSNICLATISIEIIGLLLIANFYSILFKNKHRYLLLLFSCLNIFLYYIGIKYSEQILQLPSFDIQITTNTFYGIFIFIGGIVSNFKLAFIIGFVIMLSIIIYFFHLKGTLNEKLLNTKMFSVLLFLAILTNAILVQIGRNVTNDPNSQLFTANAIRFSLFHLYGLLVLLLISLDYLEGLTISESLSKYFSKVLLMLLFVFYGYNFMNFSNYLRSEKKKILVDAYNITQNFESNNYKIDIQFAKELSNDRSIIFPNLEKMKALKTMNYTAVQQFENDGTYTNIYFENAQKYSLASIQNILSKPTLFSVNISNKELSTIKIGNFWLTENKIDLKNQNLIRLVN
jgi:hypothetical protein